MRRLLLALLLVGGACAPAQAQSQDSSTASTPPAADADWIVVPYASYSPTTKIALGGAAGYYTSTAPGRPPSQLEVSFKVTQERQISAEIDPEFYLNGGKWHVKAELRGSKYPGSFHGVGGDTRARDKESFTSRFGLLDVLVQQRVRPHLYLGPRVFVRVGDVTNPEAGGLIATNQVVGADGGTTAGLGGTIRWDGRDNHYFPTSGLYAQAVGTWYSSMWGSDHTFGYLKTDLRGYRSVGPGVLAGQVFTAAIAGRAPFTILPSLGGDDLMRGYHSGRFRDRVLWSTQAEYRMPLVWRFKGTAFASAGEVASHVGPTLFENVEMAAGLGLRFRLTESGLHGRFDVGYSRTGIDFYLSVGEAF